jgi:hypothetical protein
VFIIAGCDEGHAMGRSREYLDTSEVATAEQANNGDSLDTQRQQITGYAMMKGWEGCRYSLD